MNGVGQRRGASNGWQRSAIAASALAIALVIQPARTAAKELPEIRIGTEGGFLPWNYTKPDGTLAGFEIDLAKDLCRRMQVRCTITSQSFNSLIPALTAGKYDALMDDLIVTPRRSQVIAFSKPYASSCYSFAALKTGALARRVPPDERIVALSDGPAAKTALLPLKAALKGKIIGALMAGNSVAFIDAYLGGAASVRQYSSPEARDLDLAAGRVDAVVMSKDSLVALSTGRRKDFMTIIGPCFQGGVVGAGPGVGFRKQDTGLKAKFDAAITEAQKDGTIRRLSIPVFGLDVTPR